MGKPRSLHDWRHRGTTELRAEERAAMLGELMRAERTAAQIARDCGVSRAWASDQLSQHRRNAVLRGTRRARDEFSTDCEKIIELRTDLRS